MVDIAAIISVLKVPARTLSKVCFASTVLILLIPQNIIKLIGLLNFKIQHIEEIGLICVISLAFVFGFLLEETCLTVKDKWSYYSQNKSREKCLKNLTLPRKKIVKCFYDNDHNGYISTDEIDGLYLKKEGIILTAAYGQPFPGGTSYPCTLESWVVDYLKKHPEYLEGIG